MKKWRVFITPAAERAIKILPQKVRDFVLNDFPFQVKESPFIGGRLSGPLHWLRSFHFSIDGKPYRVAYELKQKEIKIVIHYTGYRGGFYERLRNLLK